MRNVQRRLFLICAGMLFAAPFASVAQMWGKVRRVASAK